MWSFLTLALCWDAALGINPNIEATESCATTPDEVSMLQMTWDVKEKIEEDSVVQRSPKLSSAFQVLQRAAEISSPCTSGIDCNDAYDNSAEQVASLSSESVPSPTNKTKKNSDSMTLNKTSTRPTTTKSTTEKTTTEKPPTGKSTKFTTTFYAKRWNRKYGDVMDMSKTNMKEKELPPRSRHINGRTIDADWLDEYADFGEQPKTTKAEYVPSWWDKIWMWFHDTGQNVKNLFHLTPVGVAAIAMTISCLILGLLHIS